MDTVLIILAIVLALVGVAGSIIPGLPGPPVSWVALLLLHLSTAVDYSTGMLIGTAAAAALITVLDYVVGGKETRQALRAAWGAFVGFLTGTGLKLVYTLAVLVTVIVGVVR